MMLILEHDKANVSLESQLITVSLIDSGNILEEIIDAYVMCLGQGE